MLQKWSSNFHSNCQNTLWTLINCSVGFGTLDNARKHRSNFFLHWKVCLFFKKLCLQQPLSCYRNDLLTSTVIARIPCGPLKIIRWCVSHSIFWEKIGKNFFFTGKFAFSKIFCFQQPLRCYRNYLLTSTVNARIPCGPFKTIRWGLSHSIIWEKK